jgi:hypothetical protein
MDLAEGRCDVTKGDGGRELSEQPAAWAGFMPFWLARWLTTISTKLAVAILAALLALAFIPDWGSDSSTSTEPAAGAPAASSEQATADTGSGAEASAAPTHAGVGRSRPG